MLVNISYLVWTKGAAKKIIVSSFLIVAFCTSLSAQLRDKLNMPETDEKPFHIGIVIMGTANRFQLNQHPAFLQHDSVLATSPQNTLGLGLGGMFTMRLTRRFELRAIFPQLLFVNKSITYTLKYPDVAYNETAVMNKNVESILLGLPLQIKFRSDRINNFRVYMMGGGKIEYDLSSKARAKNAEDLVKLQPFDYGIEAGVGFNFYMPYFILSPEIKISNGLGNSHSRDPNLKFSNVIDKLQTRMIVFSLIFEG
jgi:hypothetical protein